MLCEKRNNLFAKTLIQVSLHSPKLFSYNPHFAFQKTMLPHDSFKTESRMSKPEECMTFESRR